MLCWLGLHVWLEPVTEWIRVDKHEQVSTTRRCLYCRAVRTRIQIYPIDTIELDYDADDAER